MGTISRKGAPPGLALGELCAALVGVGFIVIAIASIQYREMIAPALERVTNAWSLTGSVDRP